MCPLAHEAIVSPQGRARRAPSLDLSLLGVPNSMQCCRHPVFAAACAGLPGKHSAPADPSKPSTTVSHQQLARMSAVLQGAGSRGRIRNVLAMLGEPQPE